MKTLLMLVIAAVALSAPAKTKPAPVKMTDAEWTAFFKFRKDSYFSAQKPEGAKPAPPRAPADSTEDEIKRLESLVKNEYDTVNANEVMALDKKPKALESYKGSLAQIFVNHAKKPNTKLGGIIRLMQLKSIDGRNSEGSYAIPQKASEVVVYGPVSKSVDQRERCGYPNESKPNEMRCSSGWEEHTYLVGIPSTSCHNSGCDEGRQFFNVSVESTAEVTDDTRMEENARPKVVTPSTVQIKVGDAVNVSSMKWDML